MEEQQETQAAKVWKRQMRLSSYAMAAGLLILIYAMPTLHHYGNTQLPNWLVILAVIGGLALLGGLFSFSLAVFFHLWHRKESH